MPHWWGGALGGNVGGHQGMEGKPQLLVSLQDHAVGCRAWKFGAGKAEKSEEA